MPNLNSKSSFESMFDHSFFDRLEDVLGQDYQWLPSPNLDLGCWSSNRAFLVAKEQKANPKDIASQLVIEINQKLSGSDFGQLKAVQAGNYINLEIQDLGLLEYIDNSINKISIPKSNQRIILEYICPNIAKPLHAGHLLQANYADSLRRVLSHQYKEIITNNYWGDWGVQFGILIWAYRELQGKIVSVSINGVDEMLDISKYETDPVGTLVKLYVWGSNQKKIVPNWKELVRKEHKALENGDSDCRLLRDRFFGDSKVAVEATIKRLNISAFDYNLSESSVESIIPKVLEFIKTNNIGTADELGWYVDSDFFEMPILNFGRCYLVQSKDGYTTYALRDIAAKILFAEELKYDRYITFVGGEQAHHFRQVYGILDYMNQLPSFENAFGGVTKRATRAGSLETIFNGNVVLPSGKMSTREGKFITAENILDQLESEARNIIETKQLDGGQAPIEPSQLKIRTKAISLAAIKWFNLSRDISGNSIMDMAAILKFEGNTGVYQLYTYARLDSILTKNKFYSEFNIQDYRDLDIESIEKLNTLEKQLLTKTVYLNYILSKVAQSHKVHLLTNHLYELTTMINNWYAKHSVNGEKDMERKNSLLIMCHLLKSHLSLGLNLLGIKVLDEL